MACEFTVTRQVEFSDTDMAGIVHFSNFFRFMEGAEHAFFRSLGLSIHDGDSELGWPRVHAECDFKQPLRFEDVIEIRLYVREKRKNRIVYGFIFQKLNEPESGEIARGTVTVACVKREKSGRKMKSIPIPKSIADKITVGEGPAFLDRRPHRAR